MDSYIKGQWDAFNRVLDLLNTYEDKFVDKGKLWDDIFDMRPEETKGIENDRREIESSRNG